jgi:hypothetical protein
MLTTLPNPPSPLMLRVSAFIVSSVLVLAGCGGLEPLSMEPGSIDEQVASEEPLLRYTQDTSKWVYQGLLPTLENVSVTVSLKGHTARVTGLLPTSFKGSLPFYAVKETEGTRTRIHVVYPVATADERLFNDNGAKVRNAQPGKYTVCNGSMFTPTDHSAFGGFPFIEYVCNFTDRDGRVRSGIAFHGPITTARYENTSYWSLLRGPVSHACNRMLGEHVLELARLTGFENNRRGMPVTVVSDFDSYKGKPVDVDYPSTNFQRPAGATVFRTWQAVRSTGNGKVTLEFPRWACEVSRCASMPENRLDALTGLPKK